MLYCPPNVTLNEVWVDHGISQCFMETVCASVIGGFILILGTMQVVMYHRYATEMVEVHCARLYGVQLFFTFFIPVLGITRFFLQAYVFKDGHIYGYMILSLVMSIMIFPLSAYLMRLERLYLLPSVPPRGHGFVLLLFWTLLFVAENLSFVNIKKEGWWWHLRTLEDRLEMFLFVGRYVSCMMIFTLGLKAPGIVQSYDSLNSNRYSTRAPLSARINDENRSAFRNAFVKIKTLLPFMWPQNDSILQFRVLICVLTLLAGRIINLYVPIYSKLIVDSISIPPISFRWDLILIYVLFKFLQGGGIGSMGFLNNLRSFLWIRVQQYTTRELQTELFKHLHSLPMRWHLSRKTGEVLRVMDRGTDSINNLLSYILFSIVPTLVDIVIAIIFFVSAFNMWFGLIVFSTMALYIVATISITEWRTKFQRRMNLADNAQKARSVDSLLNFETVKYYGAEQYEVMSYKEAITDYQKEEWSSMFTLNILNTMQNVIVCAGLLAGSLLCMKMIVYKEGLSVGDYVLFSSYIIQLYVPLNWFGTFYRGIQKNFVDMENMFDLFRENSDIRDAIGAPALLARRGAIEFRNVKFSYVPERLILNDVSFTVQPGKTVALVGPTGSGKSTIIRLLFRFYDVDAGSVTIDGQDVRTVTQQSLRASIGVVPQDTVLFNNSIKYNIQYGKQGSSDMDVISAAKNADIHSKILTFPDAYDTQVGERGLKLSGGEKQRIAIARTILKAPMIVLLDEATSALDTKTERNIQAALARVCTDRTTFIVAHRLSTIIHADEIMVLKDGQIVERGRHEDLVQANGIYQDMWSQQLENSNGQDALLSDTDTENPKPTVASNLPVPPPPPAPNHGHHH
ncbi:ABC transporter ATP-binding protein/permease Hmt-1 [Arctopsyche grandis]|uniref:ABC transporter ATP-binding protein/permease Hmt-1 n=1 Tax=Arctopsyche grandis TaxID=121162 RepID=UPI00406D8EAC